MVGKCTVKLIKDIIGKIMATKNPKCLNRHKKRAFYNDNSMSTKLEDFIK